MGIAHCHSDNLDHPDPRPPSESGSFECYSKGKKNPFPPQPVASGSGSETTPAENLCIYKGTSCRPEKMTKNGEKRSKITAVVLFRRIASSFVELHRFTPSCTEFYAVFRRVSPSCTVLRRVWRSGSVGYTCPGIFLVSIQNSTGDGSGSEDPTADRLAVATTSGQTRGTRYSEVVHRICEYRNLK